MTFDSIDAFLAHLATLQGAVEAAQHKGEKAAGKQLVQHAQALIGHYQASVGPFPEWAELAHSTLYGGTDPDTGFRFPGKIELGYATAAEHNPLLREGVFRASFSFVVDEHGLCWGSTDPVAVFHEHGTVKMPARPVVGPTMFVHGHEAANLVVSYMMAAFAGREAPGAGVSFAMAAE